MYAILLTVINATDLTSSKTRKHDGFRSSAFVSFFAFAVCLFWLLFLLSKGEANTIDHNKLE